MSNVVTRYPAKFEILKEYEMNNTRFLEAKFWLMHIGKNLNSSVFSEEVVMQNIDTLANTPILGFIEENSDGEIDFSDHRMVIVQGEDGLEIKYMCNAYGVIPENNDAKFESKIGDDGVTRTYLTCKGIMWKKWDEPIAIMERDEEKDVSIELTDNFTGELKDDGYFYFSSFEFFGVAILGNDEDISPAMVGASIETNFIDGILKGVEHKLKQFEQVKNKTKDNFKGGDLQVKVELDDKVIDDLTNSLLEKIKGGLYMSGENFELTASQLKDELRAELQKEKASDGFIRYFYIDHKGNEVYVEDFDENFRLFAFSFEAKGDAVEIDFENKKRIKIEFVDFEGDSDSDPEPQFKLIPQEYMEIEKDRITKELKTEKEEAVNQAVEEIKKEFEKNTNTDVDDADTDDKSTEEQLEELKTEFKALKAEKNETEQELKDLREFKENKLKEEREKAEQNLYAQFTEQLTEEELKEAKDRASEMSLEQIETALYAVLGKKKAKFTKKKDEEETVGFNFDNEPTEDKEYGGLFEKYAKSE